MGVQNTGMYYKDQHNVDLIYRALASLASIRLLEIKQNRMPNPQPENHCNGLVEDEFPKDYHTIETDKDDVEEEGGKGDEDEDEDEEDNMEDGENFEEDWDNELEEIHHQHQTMVARGTWDDFEMSIDIDRFQDDPEKRQERRRVIPSTKSAIQQHHHQCVNCRVHGTVSFSQRGGYVPAQYGTCMACHGNENTPFYTGQCLVEIDSAMGTNMAFCHRCGVWAFLESVARDQEPSQIEILHQWTSRMHYFCRDVDQEAIECLKYLSMTLKFFHERELAISSQIQQAVLEKTPQCIPKERIEAILATSKLNT